MKLKKCVVMRSGEVASVCHNFVTRGANLGGLRCNGGLRRVAYHQNRPHLGACVLRPIFSLNSFYSSFYISQFVLFSTYFQLPIQHLSYIFVLPAVFMCLASFSYRTASGPLSMLSRRFKAKYMGPGLPNVWTSCHLDGEVYLRSLVWHLSE